MPDLERLLRSTLEEVGSAYEPADEAAARERFLKRKRARRFRLAISGVAVTAAAVAAALFVFSVPATEDEPLPSAAAPQPVATIAVGDEPISASAVGGEIWVAEKDSSTISRIDPATDEVERTISVDADPDEVAVDPRGTVWVAYEDGSVTRVYSGGVGTLGFEESFQLAEEGEAVHLDLAAAPDGLVAVDPATGEIFEVSTDPSEGITQGSGGPAPRFGGGFSATDVSYGDEGIWFLDGRAGEVLPYPELRSGEPLARELSNRRSNLPRMQGGDNADLAVAKDSLWIATGTGGSLFRIDLTTGDIDVEHEVGGRYTDLAVEGNTVWALTGGNGPSMLRQFDAASGRVVGDSLEMSGRPTDVTAADGSAWVTDGDGANVVRVDPSPVTEEEAEAPEDDEVAALIDPDDLVFAYSERGDIYVQPRSGDPIRVTDTRRKSEVNPTISPEGDAIVYEVEFEGLVRFDLISGESQDLGEGSNPSFGPDGWFAWVVNNAADGTEILVGPPGGEPTQRVSAEDCSAEAGGPPDPAQMCPMIVRNISWAPDGSAIYYEAGWEFDFPLYQLQMGEGSQPFDLGEATGYEIGGDVISYSAPTAVTEDSIHVVRSCCTQGADQDPTSHEFGLIRFTEGGPEYEELFDLGVLDATATDWQAVPLGTWTLREDGTWEESTESTWLISDSTTLWVVDESGDSTEVRDPGPGEGGDFAFKGLASRR